MEVNNEHTGLHTTNFKSYVFNLPFKGDKVYVNCRGILDLSEKIVSSWWILVNIIYSLNYKNW